MRLSAKAQYACVAMVELACNWGERAPVHLKTIADNHGISQRFLVQILLQLKGTDLVESTRGAAGGYQLAKPPQEITLADVIHAIDQAPPPSPLWPLAGSQLDLGRPGRSATLPCKKCKSLRAEASPRRNDARRPRQADAADRRAIVSDLILTASTVRVTDQPMHAQATIE